MAFPITKLDLTDQLAAILKKFADPIKQAIAQDERDNSKLAQSKVIGECFNALRYEIQRQGKIYTDEETKATKFVTAVHERTKKEAAEAENLLKALDKNWDEKVSQQLVRIAEQVAEAAEKTYQLGINMNNHMCFRPPRCVSPEGHALLGENLSKSLDSIYKGIQEPPMTAWMGCGDLRTKIDEHAKRTQQYASMLPALKKKAEKDSLKSENELQAVVDKIRQDADAVRKTKQGILTQQVNAKTIEGELKNPKLDKKRWEGISVNVKTVEQISKKLNSQLKTSEILAAGAPKKAGVYAKETAIKDLIKQMEADVKEMTTKAAEVEKAATALRKLYDQVGKKLK